MSSAKPDPSGQTHFPDIDCVIIGVNCQQTLGRCLASVQASDYPADKLHIIYVDGGSTDQSLKIAGEFAGISVISLNPEYPTPGLGRNRGWKKGTSPFIQFLDSDTILAAGWLKTGIAAMADATVGAVQGLRREMHPERSIFNWIGELEWNGPAGEADSFGGDVMIRRRVLEMVGGYDEILVGGEDPELSQRTKSQGWRILRLETPMTHHDLAMTTIKQYLRRAFRSGYAFAAVRDRIASEGNPFWQFDLRKIVIKGGGFLVLALIGLLTLIVGQSLPAAIGALLSLAAGAALLCLPRLFKIEKFMHDYNLTREQARRYAWHFSLVVLPQLFGAIRYYWGKWLHKPLRNRQDRLATGGLARAKHNRVMEKIAYLCSEYPAISQTFIFREIESLRQSGFEVATISIHPQINLDVMTVAEQQEAANTLVMTRLSWASILGGHLLVLLRSPLGYIRMALTALTLLTKGPKSPVKALAYFVEAGILLHWLHQSGIRHIHEHFAAPTAIVAMLAKSYGGISYSLSVHGPDIFFTQDSALLADKVKIADFVRCISQFCRSQLMRITPPTFWKHLHIVRCGVDPLVYEARPEPNNLVPEILCVGRLVPAKGQHILLSACALLKDRGVPFRLTLVGGGEDRSSLEHFAAEAGLNGQVRFTGPLGQDKVREYYNQTDMFVLASFAEGVPVVLMEAMAKGIPVISTRIAGIPELIDHGRDGLLANPGDVEDLARQMETLIMNSTLQSGLGVAGRRKVMQTYHQHRNNLQMADLFHQYGTV